MKEKIDHVIEQQRYRIYNKIRTHRNYHKQKYDIQKRNKTIIFKNN